MTPCRRVTSEPVTLPRIRRLGCRDLCFIGFTLACTATALAACGLASREDNSKGATLSRTYPIEMQKLANCAFERLDMKYQKIKKIDFPDRYLVKLRREADLVTIWDIDLIAADQDSTRVVITIPPKIGNVQPEQLFADVEPCAGPQPGGPRGPG
jgi:hypothetical protein